MTRSRRTPTRATSRAPASADATQAVADVASHNTPVLVAEYPRTCCTSSVAPKMNEKKAATASTTSPPATATSASTSSATPDPDRRAVANNRHQWTEFDISLGGHVLNRKWSTPDPHEPAHHKRTALVVPAVRDALTG